MRRFSAIPINRKLMLIIMATSSAALVLACFAFAAYEIVASRQVLPKTMFALADMIGVNSKAALKFEDPKAARDTLESLRAQSQIVSACIYTPEAQVLASYTRADQAPDFVAPELSSEAYRFERDRLFVFHRVIFDDEWIGTVYLESDLHELRARIQRYSAIAVTVLSASLLVAFLLSAKLRRVISDPILQLAQTANVVATQKNYSVRAVKQSEDELGQLIGGFNEMLGQIQARDAALQEAHDELERRVEERTAALTQANAQLKQEIRDRLNLEAQLRQSQKMEAIGQLAAGVAHDFNNIMTIIQGYTSLVLSSARLSPQAEESLRQVSGAADRAAHLTRQLLTFSRKQAMTLRSLDLNDLVSGVTKMLGRILGEHVLLQCAYAPGLPAIQADAGMLEQLITNLAVNARDAMPNGGKLIVRTNRRDIDASYANQNPEARPGRFVCLEVTDTGCGMESATLGKLFEPFFTTKDVGKGTGLGLATVYGIVKQHEGWIEVSSGVGQGSTFRVFFPASEARPVEELDKPAADQNALNGRETILVVEDEPALRRLARRVLSHYGYRVLEADTGSEALNLWRRHSKEIDLLLTDVVMPGGMNGRELADQLRTQERRLRVIFTTGYSLDVMGQDFVPEEGVVLLPKPYQPKTLARAVRECLDGKAPSS
ncbi:MAG: response regulator [Verrucomicrobia bacterium]|nr:response regulator [Verrucomicrobiota bacterium]